MAPNGETGGCDRERVSRSIDLRYLSFIGSDLNDISRNAPAIRRIVACLEGLGYDPFDGVFFLGGQGVIGRGAKGVVRRSALRDRRAIQGRAAARGLRCAAAQDQFVRSALLSRESRVSPICVTPLIAVLNTS